MALKTPDLLNRIPSVSELLDKPPIRALTDRWNRSVVAAGVRSFLDELRSDLQRRAAEMPLPSIRELAERAARHVVSLQQQSQRPAINATGQILGPPWVGGPLADAALERAVALGRDYVINLSPATGDFPALSNDVEPLLCRVTGAPAALAVHSYAGALWLTLATLAADREVLISRAEVGNLDSIGPLPPFVTSAGALLKEVGTTNRTLAADYEAAVSPRVSVLLKLSCDGYRVVGDTGSAELEELIGLARDRELVLIDALGAAPLVEPPPPIDWPRRSVRASLAAGADLVLARGDGLVGGPSCGIIAGSREIVGRIAAHPLCAAWQLDAPRSAALAASLQCYESSSHGQQALPVWQCLTAPVENLRNRAERLAPQVAQAAGIAAAVAIETRSPLSAAVPPECGWPSHGVALTAADGDVLALEKRLSGALHPVIGRVEGERLVLDLRTVFPRQDQQLVEAIVGGKPADSAS